jgi:ribosomal protein L16 Arg81 hydroxylase
MGSGARGEEMMVGMESVLMEEVVWGEESTEEQMEEMDGIEAQLGPGDGLYIPQGWWHSVKGIGEGVNASVSHICVFREC